jgi:hypothetical protein
MASKKVEFGNVNIKEVEPFFHNTQTANEKQMASQQYKFNKNFRNLGFLNESYVSPEYLDFLNQEIKQRKSRENISKYRKKQIQNYKNREMKKNENENTGCFSVIVKGVKKILCLKGGKTRSKRVQRKRRTHKRR